MATFESKKDIIVEIDRIKTLPKEQQQAALEDYLNSLSREDLRAYLEFCKEVKIEKGFKRSFREKDARKQVLMEFTNLSWEFQRQMAFLGMMMYIQERFKQYDGCSAIEKNIIGDFIQYALGAKEHHLGTIRQLTQTDTVDSSIEIPELPEPFKSEILTSYEQLNNYETFSMAHYEELRCVTKAYTGLEPSMESSVYIHGIFDTEKSLQKYRNEHAENIDTLAHVIPVGVPVVTDPYRSLFANVTVYDSTDPDIEKLFQKKRTEHSIKSNNLLNRIKADKTREVDPESLEKINKYQKGIKDIDELNRNGMTEQQLKQIEKARESLMDSLNKAYNSACANDEVIVPIVDPNNKEKKLVKMKRTEYESIKSQ